MPRITSRSGLWLHSGGTRQTSIPAKPESATTRTSGVPWRGGGSFPFTPLCPKTIACQYAEYSMLPSGYRLQSLAVCGANCTTQYWVSSLSDGQQLLEIDPVRGGAWSQLAMTITRKCGS